MSAILTRVQIGQQGSLPGQVLLSSTDDLATITSPGYLKANEGGVSLLPTDIIEAVYGNPMINKQFFTPTFIGNQITLVAISGGGTINGATNLGTGDGLLGVAGDNITGKSLIAGANISLTPTGTDITIAATGSGGGTITGIVDVGTGTGHLSAGTSGANVQVKTLVAGNDVVITESGTTVTIASTAGNNGLTTLANLPGGEGIFAGLSGTVAQLKSIAAGAGIDITASGNNVIITNVGGGGGSNFEYQNTQWVAKNGNDANDGLSINTPKLTVQAAITALGGNGIIHIEDNGTYTGAWNIGSNDITIEAPAAFLNTSGVTASSGAIFKVNAYSFGTNFSNMFPAAGNFGTVYLNVQKMRGNVGNGTNNPNQLFITAQEITGDYTLNGGSTTLNFDSLAGDVIDTGIASAAPSVHIFGYSQTGNITSANTNIGGYLEFSSGSPTITGIKQGYFNGTYYGDQRNTGTWFNVGPVNGQPYNVVTWNTAQTNVLNGSNFELYANAYINYTGNNGYGRFDLTNDAAVPVGFKCWMFQNINDNQTGVLSSGVGGVANIVSPSTVPGVAYTRRNGSWILLTKVDQSGGVATFNVSGDLWQSNLITNANNVYVSQLSGSDTSGTGTIEAPYATIQFAVTSVGTPVNPTTIFILDGQTYNEAVTISEPNIYLVGPEALLTQTTGGDALTFTTNGVQHLINLGSIIVTGGGNAIVNTGTASIVSTGEVCNGPIQTTNGQVFIRAVQLVGNYASLGSGFIRYTATFRNGTDGANVVGINPVGASSEFTVGANSHVTGIDYVATTPVAFIAATVTIDGAFLQDRIISNTNVGPCTWTMDTGTNLTAAFPTAVANDSFSVFVSNPTGATISLLSATDATVHGTGSNQENFTIWCRYGGSVTWDIFI